MPRGRCAAGTTNSQSEQMWCLTLATNAIGCWSTEYHGLGFAAPRRDGRDVGDEVLAHIWPTQHENVHFHGTHSVDIDGELGRCHALTARPVPDHSVGLLRSLAGLTHHEPLIMSPTGGGPAVSAGATSDDRSQPP